MVSAGIRHFKLDDVRKDLGGIGEQEMTAINARTALRVCKECEVEGLDVHGHGEQGYIL